jgi:TonB family protein
MTYRLRFVVAACLICNPLLFAQNTSAQQNNSRPHALHWDGVPACGASNPSPSPCHPVPTLLSAPSPTYSEQARKAKIEGSVTLGLIVDERGNPTNFRVIDSLGMGLDEEAIEAVKKWKFAPALKDGKPVPAKIFAEVDFHL